MKIKRLLFYLAIMFFILIVNSLICQSSNFNKIDEFTDKTDFHWVKFKALAGEGQEIEIVPIPVKVENRMNMKIIGGKYA